MKNLTKTKIEEAYKKEREIKYESMLHYIGILVINSLIATVFWFLFINGDNDIIYMLSWVITIFAFVTSVFSMTVLCEKSSQGFLSVMMLKILSIVVGFLPWYFNCATFWHFGWIDALWMSPLTFIGIFIYGGICSCKTTTSYGNDLTVSDLSAIKTQQRLAGLDTSKVPVSLVSSSEAKRMTVGDWVSLGQNMELAGYRAFSKRH